MSVDLSVPLNEGQPSPVQVDLSPVLQAISDLRVENAETKALVQQLQTTVAALTETTEELEETIEDQLEDTPGPEVTEVELEDEETPPVQEIELPAETPSPEELAELNKPPRKASFM